MDGTTLSKEEHGLDQPWTCGTWYRKPIQRVTPVAPSLPKEEGGPGTHSPDKPRTCGIRRRKPMQRVTPAWRRLGDSSGTGPQRQTQVGGFGDWGGGDSEKSRSPFGVMKCPGTREGVVSPLGERLSAAESPPL